MSEEVWKEVVGWEGLYEVSSLGRVRGLDRICSAGRRTGRRKQCGCIIRQRMTIHGHPIVNLSKNGEQKTKPVHRLVAEAFLPGQQKPTVNHKSGDRADARLSNLEWATQLENRLHACRVLGSNSKDRHGMAKLRSHQIPAIFAFSALGFYQREIGKIFGVQQTLISRVLNGKLWVTRPMPPLS